MTVDQLAEVEPQEPGDDRGWWTEDPDWRSDEAAVAEATWPCDWQVDHGITEDGERDIRECGAPSRLQGKGWACEAGHRHQGIEAELEPWGLEWEREQEGALLSRPAPGGSHGPPGVI